MTNFRIYVDYWDLLGRVDVVAQTEEEGIEKAREWCKSKGYNWTAFRYEAIDMTSPLESDMIPPNVYKPFKEGSFVLPCEVQEY
jgi:hypothetical protein